MYDSYLGPSAVGFRTDVDPIALVRYNIHLPNAIIMPKLRAPINLVLK